MVGGVDLTKHLRGADRQRQALRATQINLANAFTAR
jgi:hypothetical protein